LDKVFNSFYGTKDGSAHTAGKPNDMPLAVADSRDTMQGALNPGTVVVSEATNTRDYILNVLLADFFGVENYFPPGKTSFRETTQVKDYF
jgi:hypothetical protein